MRQRGLLFPSPVVILSIVAVAMAAIAFVATRGGEPTERVITPVADPATPSETPAAPAPEPTQQPPKKPAKPAVKRDKVYVEVYNNSGISGLAGRVADRATTIGWSVVGSDNWYGTVPASTVYYPERLKRAGQLLARDLGITRTNLLAEGMRADRLTIVLTGELG